jgi:hydrogenase assembly chaperone HypC/HupF
MCIGVPLQVQAVEGEGEFALCADGDVQERLDLRLVGPQAVGTWVLSFQGAARRVLDAEEAAQIRAALQALHAALHGDAASIDVLFADLVNREPQLPPHLVPAGAKLH